MQTARDAACIVAGVILVSVLGEPLRRLRSRQKQQATTRGAGAPASSAA